MTVATEQPQAAEDWQGNKNEPTCLGHVCVVHEVIAELFNSTGEDNLLSPPFAQDNRAARLADGSPLLLRCQSLASGQRDKGVWVISAR